MRPSGGTPEQPVLPPDPAQASYAEATTGAVVVSAGAWNAFSHFVPQLYTLVQSIAAARFLGPDRMGRQSFIAWASLAVVFLWSRGLPDAMLRFAAETLGRGRAADVRGLVRWAVRIELVAAAVALAVVTGIGQLRGDLEWAWALAGFACATHVVRSIPLAVLRAAHRWRESSLIGVWSGAVTMVATVAVLAAGGGITGMFAVEAAVGLGATVYARHLLRGTVTGLAPAATADAALHHRVLRYSGAATGQAVFVYVVWQRSEFVLLDHYGAAAEIAVYSVAFGAVTVLARVLQGIAAVVPGSVATLHGAGDTERIRSGFARGVRLLLFVTLPLATVSAAAGPATIRLAYGDDYARAGRVLLVLLAAVPAVALYHLGFGLLQGLGRLRFVFLASVVGAVADIGVAIALVPREGAVGAGWANAAAQTAAAAVVLVAAARVTGGAPSLLGRAAPMVLSAAVAGGAAAGVLAVLPELPGVLLGGAAGVAAYAVTARWTHALAPEDAGWLARSAGPRWEPWVRRLASSG